MTQRHQFYRCSVCGNITEVLHPGAESLVCCGQPMELLAEQQVDALKEKHLPVIEKNEDSVKVKVGSIPHPMEEAHFIEWIAIVISDIQLRKFLNPGDEAVAEFSVKNLEGIIEARAYCNQHGLWKNVAE